MKVVNVQTNIEINFPSIAQLRWALECKNPVVLKINNQTIHILQKSQKEKKIYKNYKFSSLTS